MERLDLALYLLLNAGMHPAPAAVALARFLAVDAIWLLPPAMVWAWLRGSRGVRTALTAAFLASLFALGFNQLIGLAWFRPRPFSIGLGHTLLAHAADSSFPSDHLTAIWSVAFSLAMRPPTRRAGALLAALGLPVAWARIFLGVHFPSDMAGAALVALACSTFVALLGRTVVEPLARTGLGWHARLLAPLIRRGWVRE